MSKKRVSCVVALLVVGAFVCAGARADEMTSAPAVVITSPSGYLSWTGIYLGANGGYGWSKPTATFSANDPAAEAGTCGGTGHGQCIPQTDFHLSGPLFGGQAGFNWQFMSYWVAGLEADYQWANFTGQGGSPFHLGNIGATSALTTMNVSQSIKSFGTVRARIGVVPANPVLAYITGGFAFGQVNENFNMPSIAAGSLTSGGYSYVCGAAGSTCFAGSSSKSAVGWTVGGGAEYALTNNVLFRGEVLFIDLGSQSATVVAQQTTKTGPTAASFSASISPAAALFARGGLNFKF